MLLENSDAGWAFPPFFSPITNVRPHTQITASIDHTSTLLAVPNPWSRVNRVF